ncbi:MAG: hypothetical protein L6R42_000564 [Xanthoria sp. 1 TBL-2021]|nr:MAG: hypothetical protein L6R42_000564 [Xanthoria sp. 1 TBL-2021]
MPGLLDLPNEILSQIASYAVPTSEYLGTLPRPSCLPSHWYTCKRWYNVVSPIFYEGMLRSKKQRMLYLSYNDLVRLPGEQTQLYRYYSTKLEKISLRLQGQPSHDLSIRPFFDCSNESQGDNGSSVGALPDANSDSHDRETASPDSSTIGSVGNFDRDYQNFLETQGRLLGFRKSNWKKDLARRLRIFSDLVSKCESLDELTFQAYYGYDSCHQSQWDYLDCGAMEYFVLRLPPNLKYLTLDLAGTMMVPSPDSESEHLCPAVAQCILNVENVRLRLRHACPSVFGIKSIQISPKQECTQESTQPSVNSVSRTRGRQVAGEIRSGDRDYLLRHRSMIRCQADLSTSNNFNSSCTRIRA